MRAMKSPFSHLSFCLLVAVFWAYGDIYAGEWKDGKQHGQGTLTLRDDIVAEGTWRDGEFLE